MVFKRRDRRPIWKIVTDFLYPRGGWLRAFEYVKHRVRRLPDTPEKIGRGIWAGVFVAFTPFYGLHFIMAWLIALVMRGNVLAALLSTFFGNPLTYVPIAATSMWFGQRLLGTSPIDNLERSIGRKFEAAWGDLWHNIKAIFSDERMEWAGLARFYDDVFFPFMVGGLVPGVLTASACYIVTVPILSAHQNRRRRKLKEKLDQLSE